MDGADEKVVAVILVAGPSKGTRFRPLSFNTPEPLFPLAGQPMVHHHISACKRIPNLVQVFLIGYYDEREFALYCSSVSNELKVPVRYLKEDKPHGSAGSFYYFRDRIMEESPSHIFLLNFDVCCNSPLPEMLEAHKVYGGIGTLLVIKVSAESASQFGELVADPTSQEVLHYTEKPETRYISAGKTNLMCARYQVMSLSNLLQDFVRLDQDILSPLAGKKQLFTYETTEFWEQIKTPGMSIKCSALYLSQIRSSSPHLLACGDGKRNATVVGDVYVHPSARVHPTSKIGPNVSISANVRIAPGVRLKNCIVLDDVEIQ